MYNNGNWQPNYAKLPEGQKTKHLTLYACFMCGGSGETNFGEGWDIDMRPCPTCNGTGRKKHGMKVRAAQYYKIMKEDREACGMPYRGKNVN